MKNVALGNTGVVSSLIGLGCMGMSEFYGETDNAESLRTLERAYDLGVTHYDTSNAYGRGHNEQLVGTFAKAKRQHLTIATKFGVVRDPEGPLNSAYDRGIDNSPAYMRRCCEESLQRLGTDYIDLYYVHRLDGNIPVEDTVGELARLVAEGKIRSYGLSEVSAETLRRANDVLPAAALQSEYSLWTRDVETDILAACRETGTTFVAYSPLGRGFLTGAIQTGSDLAENDFRLTSPRFEEDNLQRNRRLVEDVKRMADEKGCTAGQIAIAWLLHRGQDIVPIPGTKRIKYLEENVAAKDVHLSAEDLALLDSILPPGAAAGSRYKPGFAASPMQETGQ
jgi:aryl-alcohol dehydrogenase-like predicted oxidoreductase